MNMKPALLSLLSLTLSLQGLAPKLHAQVAGAPAYVDYQGEVYNGSTQAPLGSSGTAPNFTAAPQNYTMQFRIYDAQSAGNLIYAETQTVTVTKGQFSVRLGAGAAIGGFETKGPPALSIAAAFNAKERYLELTAVVPPATVTTATPTSPRLAFQSSPFAFVAERAKTAESANTVTGVTGAVNANGGVFSSGTFGTAGAPATFVGNGTGITSLAGGNLQAGTVDIAKLAAAVQQALCPAGTIVAYGGDTAPAGWILCNGASVSRGGTYGNLFTAIGTRFGTTDTSSFNVPDFRGRFLRGVDGSAGRDPDKAARTFMNAGGNQGNLVGSVQEDQLEAHTHEYLRNYGTADTGSGKAITDYYGSATATTSATGGSETRPTNANVNYIIKY